MKISPFTLLVGFLISPHSRDDISNIPFKDSSECPKIKEQKVLGKGYDYGAIMDQLDCSRYFYEKEKQEAEIKRELPYKLDRIKRINYLSDAQAKNHFGQLNCANVLYRRDSSTSVDRVKRQFYDFHSGQLNQQCKFLELENIIDLDFAIDSVKFEYGQHIKECQELAYKYGL